MRRRLSALFAAPVLLAGCATDPDRHTLADLSRMEPDVADVAVDDGLEQAIRGYRDFLEETPESELTPDAMRRLADLKVEKVYGILGDGELRELPASAAPPPAPASADAAPTAIAETGPEVEPPTSGESDEDFEERTTATAALSAARGAPDL